MCRNQSVIIDHCIWQLLSYMTCLTCGLKSVTFDPFLSLSVPIPSPRDRQVLRNAKVIETHLTTTLPYGGVVISYHFDVETIDNISTTVVSLVMGGKKQLCVRESDTQSVPPSNLMVHRLVGLIREVTWNTHDIDSNGDTTTVPHHL